MSTELPIVRIHDTDFYVDLRGMQFVQADQLTNCIRFDDVQDNDTYCLLLYDTTTKNAFQGTWSDMRQSQTVVEVRLPSLAELDPPTLAELILQVKIPPEDLARAAQILQQIEQSPKRNFKNKNRR